MNSKLIFRTYFLFAYLLAATCVFAAQEKQTPGHESAKRLDLNSASEAELKELPGIGDVMAKKIIAGRPYSSIDGLVAAGIPERTVEKLRSSVTVSRRMPADGKTRGGALAHDPSYKVDLNSASVQELESLPGVGEVRAKQIVENRPYKSVDELSRAGLSDRLVQQLAPLVKAGRASSTTTADSPRQAGQTSTGTAAGTSNTRPAQGGKVWVNTESKIYHFENDPWYGKTKHGEYMTEQEAIQIGARASKVK